MMSLFLTTVTFVSNFFLLEMIYVKEKPISKNAKKEDRLEEKKYQKKKASISFQ